MIDKESLRHHAATYNIPLTDTMLEQFDIYARVLVEWNSRLNLTAITDGQGIVVKHFLDSILALKAVELPEGAALIDVGTGAGFPGIPLRIVRPDIRLTLLDSLNKRVAFLQEISHQLGQRNLCVHSRAEELAKSENHREGYDCATARAVAALPALCEYCLPYVRVGGCFLALKGYEVEEELASAQSALALLGGEVEAVHKLELPQANRRAVVVVRKKRQTPAKYPRAAVKITKSPL